LIGFGRIARGMVERLQGWSMRIVVADPYVTAESFPVGVDLVDFDSLMATSDVVCATVALTPETRNMLDARAFALMKPEAFFINISRGGVVDEVALEQVLREKCIAGAALDVFQIEPLPADSPLRTLDNCYLTPHLVGHTKGVYGAMAPAAEENTMRILAGEAPLYCKNPEALDRWRTRLARLGSNSL
jgi:phosphoglycerate dehydrogenase-like enzyme